MEILFRENLQDKLSKITYSTHVKYTRTVLELICKILRPKDIIDMY